MDVKSQLKNAQIEHVTEAAKGDPLLSRIIHATDSGNTYIGNGTIWIRLNESGLGDVRTSALEDGVFQTINGSSWVLADGRDVTGSDYHTLTGSAFIPDYRGVFLRGKNNGRIDGNENPDGEIALGTFTSDQNKSHTHTVTLPHVSGPGGSNNEGYDREGQTFGPYNLSYTSTSNGGNEARPKNVTVNYFIKINK